MRIFQTVLGSIAAITAAASNGSETTAGTPGRRIALRDAASTFRRTFGFRLRTVDRPTRTGWLGRPVPRRRPTLADAGDKAFVEGS
jgi:hypothetical protein